MSSSYKKQMIFQKLGEITSINRMPKKLKEWSSTMDY